jgi:small Trp-rich protein
MWFIVAGVLLVALKLADIGPVEEWSWWVVLAPFGLAALWWAYADSTGLTKKREMDKLEERKVERRRRNMEALGIDRERQKADDAAVRARKAAAERVEGSRARKREEHEKVIRDSVFDSKQSTGFSELPDDKPAPKDKR